MSNSADKSKAVRVARAASIKPMIKAMDGGMAYDLALSPPN